MEDKTKSQTDLNPEILYNNIISSYVSYSIVRSTIWNTVILFLPGFFELILLLLHNSISFFGFIFMIFVFVMVISLIIISFIVAYRVVPYQLHMRDIVWKVKITNDSFVLVYGDDTTKEILFSNIKGFPRWLGMCECEMVDGTRIPLNGTLSRINKNIVDKMIEAFEKWKRDKESKTTGWLYNDIISEYVIPASQRLFICTALLFGFPLLWEIDSLFSGFLSVFDIYLAYLTSILLIVTITGIFVTPVLVRRKYDMSKIIWKVNLTDESCIIVYGDEKTKEIPFSSVKGFKSHPWSVDWEIFMTDGTKFTLLGINKRIMARIVDAFEKWKIRRSVH